MILRSTWPGCHRKGRSGIILLMLPCITMLLLASCATKPVAVSTDQPVPISKPQQPQPERLKPGLSVKYIYGFYRKISKIPKGKMVLKRAKQGKPILKLDHQFGNLEVFDSGVNRGVAMRMTGFIRFPESGTYAFQALSNDGIQVTIGGIKIVEDPTVHSDRLSSPGVLNVEAPGWRAVTIWYFQRKGTAAIKLFWKPPGASAYHIIPASAYAHTE